MNSIVSENAADVYVFRYVVMKAQSVKLSQ